MLDLDLWWYGVLPDSLCYGDEGGMLVAPTGTRLVQNWVMDRIGGGKPGNNERDVPTQ